MFSVSMTSKSVGTRHQRHGRRIHIHVIQLDVGILLPDLAHHLAPQAGAIQDVGLVHGSHFAAARARQLKSHARDALDFGLAVAHGVDGHAIARSALRAARLSEVDASQQFPHDQDIGAAHHIRPQRRRIFQAGKAQRRPQIGKHSQFAPQPQQPALRPQMAGKVIE